MKEVNLRLLDFNIDGKRGLAWEKNKMIKTDYVDAEKRLHEIENEDNFQKQSEMMNNCGGRESPIIQAVRVDTAYEKELLLKGVNPFRSMYQTSRALGVAFRLLLASIFWPRILPVRGEGA